MSMLKGLKNKKDGKADPKKDKKDKQTKKDVKKQVQQQEQDIGDPLVDMSEFDNTKEETKTPNKKINKILTSKLEEKQIDTSNIVVEKKEEKKEIKSWIVQQSQISRTFVTKFDMNKVDTEFSSLTDEKFNKELEVKAKKQAEENKYKVEEKGGVKFAPLEKPVTASYVDANQPNFIKRPSQTPIFNLNPGIQIASNPNPPQFTNSSTGAYVPLEKTPQQIREEAMEKRSAEITLAPKKQEGWLGKKPDQTRPAEPEMKISGWATKGAEDSSAPPLKFAPLQKSATGNYGRQQQQFVFVSKKEQDQRRKKREQLEKEKINKG